MYIYLYDLLSAGCGQRAIYAKSDVFICRGCCGGSLYDRGRTGWMPTNRRLESAFFGYPLTND